MNYFFSKKLNRFNLKSADYYKCPNCGFCASKTHFEMSAQEWSKLNEDFHNLSHFAKQNPYNRNQRYFNQALMLHLMVKEKTIKPDKWLDWGAGIGSVSKLLNDIFSIKLLTYDKYFKPLTNQITESKLKPRNFNLVVNTCVFEHGTCQPLLSRFFKN